MVLLTYLQFKPLLLHVQKVCKCYLLCGLLPVAIYALF